eukprot:TRINITY_DN24977_c1_g1_i4.p3 TRINITY_DN24977_c1_g1~~TRINITY_DN24977_c1_g1_i4.p3  ORF type:complete len:107 (-),score=15.61 TRINITY_DN24977_c1_g1_i4:948-1223(-)
MPDFERRDYLGLVARTHGIKVADEIRDRAAVIAACDEFLQASITALRSYCRLCADSQREQAFSTGLLLTQLRRPDVADRMEAERLARVKAA